MKRLIPRSWQARSKGDWSKLPMMSSSLPANSTACRTASTMNGQRPERFGSGSGNVSICSDRLDPRPVPAGRRVRRVLDVRESHRLGVHPGVGGDVNSVVAEAPGALDLAARQRRASCACSWMLDPAKSPPLPGRPGESPARDRVRSPRIAASARCLPVICADQSWPLLLAFFRKSGEAVGSFATAARHSLVQLAELFGDLRELGAHVLLLARIGGHVGEIDGVRAGRAVLAGASPC